MGEPRCGAVVIQSVVEEAAEAWVEHGLEGLPLKSVHLARLGVNESEGQIVRLRVAFFKEGRFPNVRRPGRIVLDPPGLGKYPAPCANCSQAVENRLSLVCPPFSFTPVLPATRSGAAEEPRAGGERSAEPASAG